MIITKLVASTSAALLLTSAAVFVQPGHDAGQDKQFAHAAHSKVFHSNFATMTESERAAYIRQQLATANARFP
ncbi:hypothetical protein KOI40_00205 [Aestuariicella sp. G3-2]|uniref:hypothetical protein n=1 Tax=Pseudomaricurvus albidus TaxID=2842452 RepID=UPI001C0E5395|nr:hypothetical protein [Aestuariicella albida]MBU3068235.1 hypothetical protein [Aestuariicella albida]